MKALVSIQFAVTVDDDAELAELVRGIDQSVYGSIVGQFSPEKAEQVAILEEENCIDWYGTSVCLKRPVFQGLGALEEL